jgi:hypothetical protein
MGFVPQQRGIPFSPPRGTGQQPTPIRAGIRVRSPFTLPPLPKFYPPQLPGLTPVPPLALEYNPEFVDYYRENQLPLTAPSNTTPKNTTTNASKTGAKKKKVDYYGLLTSTIALTMGPLYLLSTLLGAKSGGAIRGKYVKEAVKPGVKQLVEKLIGRKISDETVVNMYNISKVLLTCSVFPKSLNGIRYGLASEQPSMVFEHLFEICSFPFALTQKAFIQSILFMVSGLFSLGLANDLENEQKRKKGDPNLRIYKMDHLKALVNPHIHIAFRKRLSGLASEFGHMAKFVGGDIVLGVKRAGRDSAKLTHTLGALLTISAKRFKRRLSHIKRRLTHKGKEKIQYDPSLDYRPVLKSFGKNELTNGQGTAGKASMNFTLLQLGTIPKLALTFIPKDTPMYKVIEWYGHIVQGVAAVVGDFSVFLLGKQGKTIGEKIPVVGVTLEATGRIMNYGKTENPVANFLQYVGAAGNSLFYAVRASKLENQKK